MRLGAVTISGGFVGMTALVLLFDRSGLLPLVMVAAGIHELGHFAAIYLMGGRVRRLHFGLVGLCIDYEGQRIGYWGEIVLALSGPFANFVLAYGASVWGVYAANETLFLLAGVSMGAALFNLLPIYQLDGGRAIYCFLALVLDSEQAWRGVCVLSCGTILLLLALGVWLFLWSGWNFTLLAAAVWLMISYCKSRGSAVKCG